MQSAADRIHARVARLAAEGASPAEVASAAAEEWRAIEAVLAPIVGGRGFIAIVHRSMHLVGPSAEIATLGADPIAAWQRALADRSAADATESSARLLREFCNLLVALIGGSLTERLLRPVWDRPTPGAGDQDTTS
jgi:hypothetical protein